MGLRRAHAISATPCVPGLENHFGVNLAHLLSPEERVRFHLLGMDDILNSVCNGDTLVIVDPWIKFSQEAPLKDVLAQCGYHVRMDVEGTAIYARE